MWADNRMLYEETVLYTFYRFGHVPNGSLNQIRHISQHSLQLLSMVVLWAF